MPSSSVSQRLSLEQYYDANARYRSTRHYHARRISHRHKRNSTVHVSDNDIPPAQEVARDHLEPYKQQQEIRWLDFDISTVLKPMEMVTFPPDPAPFKLPPDPPALDRLLPERIEQRTTLYVFALAILGILGTGMASELNKARTCHKSIRNGLHKVTKYPDWMPEWIRRRREALSKLT